MTSALDIAQLLDLVGGIIVVIDSRQNVTYINSKGCRILGYEKADVIGKNWFDTFIPERVRDDIRSVFRKLMHGEAELAEYFDNVVLTKDGREKIIGWHNTVLRDDTEGIIGTLSLGQDMTELRRAEKIQDQRIQELQDRVIELTSMKMNIPICSWDKKDMKKAIERHYSTISAEGKCTECLQLLQMASKIRG